MEAQHTVPSPKENFFVEILKASLIALIIVVPIRFFVAQPFIVSGASMSPTFESSHYLIVDQLSFRFEKPARGDVVVFKFPNDPSKFFIKRVVGLPGETVASENGVITIINEDFLGDVTLSEAYVAEENKTTDSYRITLSDSEYFVLGDNRRASSDSRIWGPLDEELLIGRVFLRILPLSQAELLPGDSNSIKF